MAVNYDMLIIKNFIYIIAILALVSCASDKIKDNQSVPTQLPTSYEEVIDFVGLQNALKLSGTKIGFFEKSYNTCNIGHGYLQNENCRNLFMTVIRFQIVCRPEIKDPNKIISQRDLTPVANKKLKWKLGPSITGTSETNNGGYGQLIAISSQSQKNQRLKINSGHDFLLIKSHEIDQVVTPPDWCL